jgi:hypothetical protein
MQEALGALLVRHQRPRGAFSYQGRWVVTGEEPLTVLIDDTRAFADGRPCLVARSSAAGKALLEGLREVRIDHLWLDHDLVGDDDIWPVIRLLEDAAEAGRPYRIGMTYIHASRSGPAHQMRITLRRAGYLVERAHDLRLWRRSG